MRHETKNEWILNEWMNQGFGINLERILKHGIKMWQKKMMFNIHRKFVDTPFLQWCVFNMISFVMLLHGQLYFWKDWSDIFLFSLWYAKVKNFNKTIVKMS